jgi:hypothetical protein
MIFLVYFNISLIRSNHRLVNQRDELGKKLDSVKKDYDFLIDYVVKKEKERSQEIKAAKDIIETTKLIKAYQAFYTNKEIGET